MQQPKVPQKETPPIASEINEQISPLIKKITENLKLIGLIFGSIILVAATATGYKYYRIQTLQKAQSTIGQIMTLQETEQKIKELEAYLPEAPKKFKPALRLQIASLAMESEQYDRAATYWEQIAANNTDQELEVIASIGLANALHLQGKSKQALKLLSRLQHKAPQSFAQSINFTLAGIAEATENWEQSLEAYEQLKSESGLTGSNTEYLEHKISQLQQKIRQGKSS